MVSQGNVSCIFPFCPYVTILPCFSINNQDSGFAYLISFTAAQLCLFYVIFIKLHVAFFYTYHRRCKPTVMRFSIQVIYRFSHCCLVSYYDCNQTMKGTKDKAYAWFRVLRTVATLVSTTFTRLIM